MRKFLIFVALCLTGLTACHAPQSHSTEAMPVTAQDEASRELIILASPPDGDRYYAAVMNDIIDFHIAYAKQIKLWDDVLILTGRDHYAAYVKALGEDLVVLTEMEDIWMRDFTLSNAASPLMFRYAAEGQGGGRRGQRDADAVQETFARMVERAGLEFAVSDLLNDGGNFVDDYAGNVVISRKFLRDNRLTEAESRAALRKITGARNIAFIESDEQGGLEHADGVVAFVQQNTLVINSYPEDAAYAKALRADLEKGLTGVTLHEIITPYDGSDIYDKRFGSACGLYTNMLVTPRRIYFPQFGIAEDKIALEQISAWTDRQIIPVQSSQVCKMGGGVRCMSLQMRGDNAAALLQYVAALRSSQPAK
jgi:agmatine/peptidylarginine deiminase